MLGRWCVAGLINIRYVGRRSGKTIQTPVGYRRSGDSIVINVMSPDNKTWWRNFLGDGGPITLLKLDGADRTGHAVADRDEQGPRLGHRRRWTRPSIRLRRYSVPTASRIRLITRIAVASTLICGGTAAFTAAFTYSG